VRIKVGFMGTKDMVQRWAPVDMLMNERSFLLRYNAV
jgi:hypothetical protein